MKKTRILKPGSLILFFLCLYLSRLTAQDTLNTLTVENHSYQLYSE